jgi:hypothetical protein
MSYARKVMLAFIVSTFLAMKIQERRGVPELSGEGSAFTNGG